jgi:hypothetical protein
MTRARTHDLPHSRQACQLLHHWCGWINIDIVYIIVGNVLHFQIDNITWIACFINCRKNYIEPTNFHYFLGNSISFRKFQQHDKWLFIDIYSIRQCIMCKLCCITFKYQDLSFIYLLTILYKILFGTEGCIYLLIRTVWLLLQRKRNRKRKLQQSYFS